MALGFSCVGSATSMPMPVPRSRSRASGSERFNVALTAVAKGEPLEHMVHRLLAPARSVRMCLQLLLTDHGFYSEVVGRHLESPVVIVFNLLYVLRDVAIQRVRHRPTGNFLNSRHTRVGIDR
jgi:hypothetical protein